MFTVLELAHSNTTAMANFQQERHIKKFAQKPAEHCKKRREYALNNKNSIKTKLQWKQRKQRITNTRIHQIEVKKSRTKTNTPRINTYEEKIKHNRNKVRKSMCKRKWKIKKNGVKFIKLTALNVLECASCERVECEHSEVTNEREREKERAHIGHEIDFVLSNSPWSKAFVRNSLDMPERICWFWFLNKRHSVWRNRIKRAANACGRHFAIN